MSQVLTFFAALFRRGDIRVAIRLDHSGVGAHLIWTITNNRPAPVTIDALLLRGAHGVTTTMPLEPPRTIQPQGQLIAPMDADWNVLGEHQAAVVDGDGHLHAAAHRQLAHAQQRLRQAIDRRRGAPASARDFLAGATDLAFGVVILGLGFFMLMWVIATG